MNCLIIKDICNLKYRLHPFVKTLGTISFGINEYFDKLPLTNIVITNSFIIFANGT